jgi:hypothetical protein
LALVLYWSPLADFADGYSVFVHLTDANGQIVAQRDSVPCDGRCPTTAWVPGDVIEDRYEVGLPSDLPSGKYEIKIGLYLPASGERVPVANTNRDFVVLPTAIVLE